MVTRILPQVPPTPPATIKTMLEKVALLVIFVNFILIRLPTFSKPFGTEFHGDKYATYLPTVINQYERRNPFSNHNPGYFPLTNTDPNYTTPTFGSFPVVEWSILPFMPLTQYFSLEVVVRSVQTGYGLLLLGLIYLVLRKLFAKPIALTGLALLAVNPAIQLGTLITVQDLPALIFLFAAVFGYLNDKKNFAFLLAGLSALSKYSFLLINLPLFAGLVFLPNLLNRDQLNTKLYQFGKLLILGLLPIGLYPLLIKNTPSDVFAVALTKTLIFVLSLTLVLVLMKQYDKRIKKRVTSWNLPALAGIITALGLAALLLLWGKITGYAGNFLTDCYLIFNWPMYRELLRQMGNLSASSFFALIIALGVLVTKFPLVPSLFLAAATYLILASKSIFIHTYYRHIFMILFIFALAAILQIWQRKTKDKLALGLLLGGILILMLPSQITASRDILTKNNTPPSIREVGVFLEENLAPTEKALGPRTLNIYAPHRTIKSPEDVTGSKNLSQVKYFVSRMPLTEQEQVVSQKTGQLVNLTRSLKILDQLGASIQELETTFQPNLLQITTSTETKIAGWYIYSLD